MPAVLFILLKRTKSVQKSHDKHRHPLAGCAVFFLFLRQIKGSECIPCGFALFFVIKNAKMTYRLRQFLRAKRSKIVKNKKSRKEKLCNKKK
jgi:hypothetical protein